MNFSVFVWGATIYTTRNGIVTVFLTKVDYQVYNCRLLESKLYIPKFKAKLCKYRTQIKYILLSLVFYHRDAYLMILYFVFLGIIIPKVRLRGLLSHSKSCCNMNIVHCFNTHSFNLIPPL